MAETLQSFAPDDPDALVSIGTVLFEHGDAKKSYQVHLDLLERFGTKLVGTEKAINPADRDRQLSFL